MHLKFIHLLALLLLFSQIAIAQGDITPIKDSTGNSITLKDIIQSFPDFDEKLEGKKESLFQSDKEIRTIVHSMIPVKKPDSSLIALYTSTYATGYGMQMDYNPGAYLFWLTIQYDPEKRNEVSYDLGTCWYFLGELDSAEKYLSISYEFNPKEPATLTNLGWISVEREHYQEARSFFREAYDLYPNDPVYINNYGYAFYLLGNFERAEKMFNKARKLDPENPFVYRNLGLIYKSKGKKNKACKFLKKSLDAGMLENYGADYLTELSEYCSE